MKYIRLFTENRKRWDEADPKKGELDFEEFKYLFGDISDIGVSCKFDDYSDEPEPFYDCYITFQKFPSTHLPDFILTDMMEILPPEEDPDEFNEEKFGRAKAFIEANINNLHNTKVQIDSIIDVNQNLLSVLDEIVETVVPRMGEYSNFDHCDIGFEAESYDGPMRLRITFEIKNDGEEEIDRQSEFDN